VLALSGGETSAFLQDLLTNDLNLLTPEQPLWAALLSPQGKVLIDMLLFAAPAADTVWIDVAAEASAGLMRKLSMYKLRRAITVTATELMVFAAWGGSHAAANDPRLAALGQRWIADQAATNASLAHYEAHRLALGVPGSADLLIDKMLWLEANAEELHGVSFTKGCYVGQENTARMHHRDRLRKRLLPISFSGDPGDGIVRSDGREVGELRSSQGGHGIAYLRVEMLSCGALTMNDGEVVVHWPAYLPENS
jgi:hypothetical protein